MRKATIILSTLPLIISLIGAEVENVASVKAVTKAQESKAGEQISTLVNEEQKLMVLKGSYVDVDILKEILMRVERAGKSTEMLNRLVNLFVNLSLDKMKEMGRFDSGIFVLTPEEKAAYLAYTTNQLQPDEEEAYLRIFNQAGINRLEILMLGRYLNGPQVRELSNLMRLVYGLSQEKAKNQWIKNHSPATVEEGESWPDDGKIGDALYRKILMEFDVEKELLDVQVDKWEASGDKAKALAIRRLMEDTVELFVKKMRAKGSRFVEGKSFLHEDERQLYKVAISFRDIKHNYSRVYLDQKFSSLGIDPTIDKVIVSDELLSNEVRESIGGLLGTFLVLNQEKAERLWDLPIERQAPLSVSEVIDQLHRDFNPEVLVTNIVAKIAANDKPPVWAPSSDYPQRLDLEYHFGDGDVGVVMNRWYLPNQDPSLALPVKVTDFFGSGGAWLKSNYDIAVRRSRGEVLNGSDYDGVREAFKKFKDSALQLRGVWGAQPLHKKDKENLFGIWLNHMLQDYLMVADIERDPADIGREVLDFFCEGLGRSKVIGQWQSDLFDLTEGNRYSYRSGSDYTSVSASPDGRSRDMNYFRIRRESFILYPNLVAALKVMGGLDEEYRRRLAKLDEKLNFYNRKLTTAGNPEFKRQFFLSTLMAFKVLVEAKDSIFVDEYLQRYASHGSFGLGEDHVIRQKTELAKAVGAVIFDYLARLDRKYVAWWALLFDSDRVPPALRTQLFEGISEADLQNAIGYAQYVYGRDGDFEGSSMSVTPNRNISAEYEIRKSKENVRTSREDTKATLEK